jgi:hypothetical protein
MATRSGVASASITYLTLSGFEVARLFRAHAAHERRRRSLIARTADVTDEARAQVRTTEMAAKLSEEEFPARRSPQIALGSIGATSLQSPTSWVQMPERR